MLLEFSWQTMAMYTPQLNPVVNSHFILFLYTHSSVIFESGNQIDSQKTQTFNAVCTKSNWITSWYILTCTTDVSLFCMWGESSMSLNSFVLPDLSRKTVNKKQVKNKGNVHRQLNIQCQLIFYIYRYWLNKTIIISNIVQYDTDMVHHSYNIKLSFI